METNLNNYLFLKMFFWAIFSKILQVKMKTAVE